MKILVLNRGSSSIKCCVYEFSCFPDQLQNPIWETKIEWKNIDKDSSEKLREKFLSSFANQSIDCIGHRIVHGGKKYQHSVRINQDVKNEIRRLSSLAPLHNRADLEGVEILERMFPGIPQIAVFDTAFHHTLSESVTTYPGPYEWLEMGIRRYGFHGTSFQYCTRRSQEILAKDPGRMVICHLGSGASLCAVKDGKSIDTTMGFTPLEGLMMDTRSGTVDPGILLHLLENEEKTVATLRTELYEKSGLFGLSGKSSDMRDVLQSADAGDSRSLLAIDVYVQRLSTMIGSMVVSLGGMDTLVFTAGIGENAPAIRKRVCDRLSFLGVDLEEKKPKSDGILSSSHSSIKVLLIHTQEAFEIARECWKTLNEYTS